MLLVCVTPALQWTRRYCSLGASLIFEGYFLLINALHVDWLSRRHQFSSIKASAAAPMTVSPTCIIMESSFLTLVLIGSVCWTSWVEVWQNMRPWDVSSPHSSVGDPIIRLHEESLTLTNDFWSPPPGGLLEDFPCFIFLNDSASSLSLSWVGQSLFPAQWPFSPQLLQVMWSIFLLGLCSFSFSLSLMSPVSHVVQPWAGCWTCLIIYFY